MENCSKAPQWKRRWLGWVMENGSSPICEGNVETLHSMSILILENYSDAFARSWRPLSSPTDKRLRVRPEYLHCQKHGSTRWSRKYGCERRVPQSSIHRSNGSVISKMWGTTSLDKDCLMMESALT
ncbi:hypothetical protein R1flu_026551 [Riccia fluitans]|uniref:Uncharacterized protein n=1 Tax=Riccia fluitans TaxID=41844 RepID=A0ABD1XKB7_9MARC